MLAPLLSAAALAAAAPTTPAPAYDYGFYHGYNAHGGRTIVMVDRGRIVRFGQQVRGRCDDGTFFPVRATSGTAHVPIDGQGRFDLTKRPSRFIRWRIKGRVEGGEISGRYWNWYQPLSEDGKKRHCKVVGLAWRAVSDGRPAG